MPEDRFVARAGRVWDTLAQAYCDPTDTLMTYANAWAAFGQAIQSGDDRVDDVIVRAGLDD